MKEDGNIPMGGLSGLLISRFIKGPRDVENMRFRSKVAELQGWVSIVVNTFIFSAKITLGILLGSIALLADAFDSLSDVGAAILGIVGARWACKPRDARHPFGHGRAECLAALITAVMLVGVGIGIGKEAIDRVIHPHPYMASWTIIILVLLTLPLKEWLARFSAKLIVLSGSPLVEAGYWHQRFDSLMTILVCGALLASRWGFCQVDGVVGLVIAALIIRTGYVLMKERISPLLGEAPSPEEVDRVRRHARSIDGVYGAHDILIHKYGDVLLSSLHIEVDAGLSALDAHALAERVERAIENELGGRCIVHADPVDHSHPDYKTVQRIMRRIVEQSSELSDFHDLRVEGKDGDKQISVNASVCVSTSLEQRNRLAHAIESQLHSVLGDDMAVTVAIESSFEGHAPSGS